MDHVINTQTLMSLANCLHQLFKLITEKMAENDINCANMQDASSMLKCAANYMEILNMCDIYITCTTYTVWLGSVTVACHTCNPEVAGSTPSRGTARKRLWASCSHTCAYVHQAVQTGTGFITRKVTAVISGGLALLPYIRQGWVCLYWVARNTV